MPPIDLRRNTVTGSSPALRRAMAEVADDACGEGVATALGVLEAIVREGFR